MTSAERVVLETKTCEWRTGDRRCAVPVYSQRHCAFHQHWLRLVDYGVLGRQQYEEFCEWWEQFQPYGMYGDRPGFWWADCDVLWAALTGTGALPVKTREIETELLLRRRDVQSYARSLPHGHDTEPRLTGCGLPPWHAPTWQVKVKRFINKKSTGPSPP